MNTVLAKPLQAGPAPLHVRRICVVDPFAPSNGRTTDDLQWEPGKPLSYYLPDVLLRHPEAAIVDVDGIKVEPDAWDSTVVESGAFIGVAVWPGDPGTIFAVTLFVISATVSAWSAYDANRRAKIQAHHATRRAAARSRLMSDSSVYNWDGIQNTTQPGRVIPVVYGKHRQGGQVIYAEAYKDNSGESVIDVAICLSEGEIESIDTTTIEINGRPLAEYPNVSVETRVGTNAQTASTIFNPGLAIQTRNKPGNALVAGGSSVTYTTQPSRTGYELDIHFPDGLRGTDSSTETGYGLAQATFDIRHRSNPSGAWSGYSTIKTGWRMTAMPFHLSHKSGPLTSDRYDVEVTRKADAVKSGFGTAGVDSNHSRSSLGEVREYNNAALRYPNLAILYVHALSSDQLNGMLPTITVEVEGKKVDVYTAAPGDTILATGTGEITDATTFVDTDIGDTSYTGFQTDGVVAGDILVITDGGHAGAGVIGTYTIVSVDSETQLTFAGGTFASTGTSIDYRIETAAGVSTNQFSRNPAWCILDLLLNSRYGAGRYVTGGTWDGVEDLGDLDIQSFIDAAAFCDTLVQRRPSADDPLLTGIAGNSRAPHADYDNNAFFWDSTLLESGEFTNGTIKVDDTLVIEDGADAGSYLIAKIHNNDVVQLTELDGTVANLSGASGADWRVENTERRSLCDYVIDGQNNVWDGCLAMAHVARLEFIRGFGPYRLVPDTTGDAVALFGMGNVIEGTYQHEYLSYHDLANKIEVQFLNAALNYQQDVAQVEDPDVLTNSEDPIPEPIEAYGITRLSQAQRIAVYNYLSNRYERELLTFECAAEGLPLQWGDVFIFAHEITRVGEFFSGRLGSGTTGTTAVLDKGLVLPNAATIDIYVRTSTGAGGVAADTVLRGAVDQSALQRVDQVTVSTDEWADLANDVTYDDGPRPGDPYVIAPRTSTIQQYKYWKVIEITLTETGRRRISAVNHRTEVYDDAETPPATLVA